MLMFCISYVLQWVKSFIRSHSHGMYPFSDPREEVSFICNILSVHIMLVFVMEMFFVKASEKVKRVFQHGMFQKSAD